MNPMRSSCLFSMLVAAAAAACGGDAETGQYQVSWAIAPDGIPSTCAAELLASVTITTTDTATSDTETMTVACARGTALTSPVALGDHTISVRALGMQGEAAGELSISAALNQADQIVTPAVVSLDTLAPETTLVPSWTVRRQGQPSTCAAVGSTGVTIVSDTQRDGMLLDIFECNTPSAAVELPLGPFTVHAELLGAGDVPIAISSERSFPATRGAVEYTLELDVP
jgi:hypothetical protein